MKTGALLAVATTFVVTNAAGAGMDTSSWPDVRARRDVPHLMRLDGTVATWRAYLAGAGLEELHVPPEARAYRWIHDGFSGQGYVELQVDGQGAGMLSASDAPRRTKFISAKDTAAFEHALAATDFVALAEDDNSDCLDDCQDQVLEAVVNGRYHFIRRAGGLPPDIGRVVDQLHRLAMADTPDAPPPNYVWTVDPTKSGAEPK
jgi:hypothetical protein